MMEPTDQPPPPPAFVAPAAARAEPTIEPLEGRQLLAAAVGTPLELAGTFAAAPLLDAVPLGRPIVAPLSHHPDLFDGGPTVFAGAFVVDAVVGVDAAVVAVGSTVHTGGGTFGLPFSLDPEITEAGAAARSAGIEVALGPPGPASVRDVPAAAQADGHGSALTASTSALVFDGDDDSLTPVLRTLTLRNEGPRPLTIMGDGLVISGADARHFTLLTTAELPLTLAPRTSVSFAIAFTRGAGAQPGTRSATLRAVTDNPDHALAVSLHSDAISGTGSSEASVLRTLF